MLVERPPEIIRELLGLDSRLRFAPILTGGRRWGPLEGWHNFGAAGEPALQNSWAEYGSGFNHSGYFRDQRGILHLRGLVKNANAVALPSTIATIPVGLRPLQESVWVVPMQYRDTGGADTDSIALVNLNASTGNLFVSAIYIPTQPYASINWVSVDSIRGQIR